MSVIKGLIGAVSISAGDTTLTIDDYGNARPVEAAMGGSGPGFEDSGTVTYNTISARTAVLEDPLGDVISIVSAPARGKLVVREDGLLSWNDNKNIDAATLNFSYERDNNGTPETVNAVIEALKGELAGGWGLPAYYLPEVNGLTDDLVIEPGPTSRVIYCSTNGITGAQIRTAQGLDEAQTDAQTATQVQNNPQWGYGNTQVDAIVPEVAFWLFKRLGDKRLESVHLLLKRGETFPSAADFNVTKQQFPGESALHPKYVGCYGNSSDPKPYMAGDGFGAGIGGENYVLSNVDLGGTSVYTATKYIAVDGVSADFAHVAAGDEAPPVVFSAASFPTRHCALRRYKALDVVKLEPNNGVEWSFGNDRVSAFYSAETQDLLIDGFFADHTAWADDYRQDTNWSENGNGMSPDDRSHNLYLQVLTVGVTVRDLFACRPNFSAGQFRSGAFVQHVFSHGANGNFVFGGSWGRTTDTVNPDYKPDTNNYTNWGMCYRAGTIGAGLKRCNDGPSVVAGGPAIGSARLTRTESYLLNAGIPQFFTSDPTEVANGPKLSATLANIYNQGGTQTNDISGVEGYINGFDDFIVANWDPEDVDVNIGSVTPAQIDALLVSAFLDQHLSTTGSTEADFIAYCRAHDAPWELVRDLNNFALAPFGKDRPVRTVAQECLFNPFYDATTLHETPGIRADCDLDWNSEDMPGTVAGDSVNLAGHTVWWNQTPKNQLSGFTFGAGGELHQLGSALRPTTVTVDAGGNIMTMDHGSKFDLPGYSGAGNLDVTVDESRWMNTGTVAGNVSIKGRYEGEVIFANEGAAFALGSGDTADIYGFCRAGFHGAAGGTASLTAQSGSTIRFKPSIRLEITGDVQGQERIGSSGPAARYSDDWIMAKIGSTITGATSGATGTVLKVLDSKVSPTDTVRRRSYILVDVTGTFVDGEDLSASTLTLREKFTYPEGIVGQAHSPVYVMGSIAEVTTGLNGFGADGFTAPAYVNSVVTLESGAKIEVDTDGLTPGTYDLIVVDSLMDNGAILPAGVVVNANQLQLAV